jgi:hypothetical protein
MALRDPCNSQNPSAAFHTPSTLHGAAMAKHAKIRTSMALHPPTARIDASQTSKPT